MGLRSLLRSVVGGRSGQTDPKLDSVRAAMDAYRGEIRTLRKDLAAAQRQIARAEHRVEQLLALRDEDQQASDRLERLAPIMDAEAAARHAREAIAGARRADAPCPHIVIASLLPDGVYAALLEALPPQVFFAPDASGVEELRVPPELAPLHVAAVWTFIGNLARHTLAPALVEAFTGFTGERPDGRLAVEGRLVRGLPRPLPGGVVIPSDPNVAVTVLDTGTLHFYLPLVSPAAAGDVGHGYELAVGPRH